VLVETRLLSYGICKLDRFAHLLGSGPVWSVAITPDGQTLISGSEDSTIKIWHSPTGELRRTINGHSGRVSQLLLVPDGQTLPLVVLIKPWVWNRLEK